jgi:hypothetical protein
MHNAETFLQGMTNNARFTFDVGDTTWAVYIMYTTRQNLLCGYFIPIKSYVIGLGSLKSIVLSNKL